MGALAVRLHNSTDRKDHMRKLIIVVSCLFIIATTVGAAAGAQKAKNRKGAEKEKKADVKAIPDASQETSAPTDQTPAAAADSPATAVNVRFTVNSDGTVLDKNTGLVWLQDANVSNLPLPGDGAKLFLQEMNSGRRQNFGYSDWRLPTINEIQTLVDKMKFYPALPVGHPFKKVQNNFYWSSSTGKDILDYVWIVDMASGEMTMDYVSFCSYKFLWPVRSSWMPTTAKASTVMTGGANDFGQLGDGSPEDRDALLPVSGLENVVKVSAGLDHAIALKSDGSVWTWGRNNRGQLGNGAHTDSRVPVAVKDLWKVTDVAAGMFHTLALSSDGTVWAWGRNSYGQLGDKSDEDASTPVRVSGLSGVVKIAAGMYHSAAVKSDGTVWTWGRNVYGQLGDGSNRDSNRPVQVEGLSGVSIVTAGMHHTVALKKDKTVWAWGWNYNGMLGDGTKADQPKPVQVKARSTDQFKPGTINLSDIIDVQAGLHHTLALKSDGSVWSWGGNEYSQLGSKDADETIAAKISGLGNIKKTAAGMYHSIALMSDGTIWIWGKDLKNQPNRLTPMRIWDVAGINDVAAGKFYTVVLSGGKSAVK
jgi:alpha-tubulin suppressor-like RCC1 family protein